MIDFNAFHFLRPEWFWALLPLLVVAILAASLSTRQSGWQSVLAGHLYQHLVSGKARSSRKWPFFLIALAWTIGVVALAGPTWKKLPQPVYQLNSGKVVLLDMSLSMRATDVTPDRLTRAKYKAIDLINAIAEGETGLVAYAGDAFTISPLSSDVQNLTTLLPSLSPEIMPVPGSDPYLGIKAAADLLNNAGFIEGEIFWITDGMEMTQLVEVRELISSLPYRISVLAVGTEDGAPIQLTDGDFLKDSRGAIVIPKLNPDPLRGLANASGGQFSLMTATDKDIEQLVNQTLTSRETSKNDKTEDKFGDEWEEAGPYLVLLLIPFAAVAFRRGYLTLLLIGTVTVGMLPQRAVAFEWQDLWKTENQQAREAFDKGQFDNAAEQFNDPLWKGSALYKQGEYDAALQAFKQVNSIESLYNQGNALAQLGELEKAIEAYQQVIQQNPNHQDAQHNKDLIEQLKQQQEEQQKQQQEQEQEQEQEQQDSEQQEQQEQQEQNSEQQSDEQQSQSQDDQSEQQSEQQAQQDSEQEQQGEQQPSENKESEPQSEDEPAEQQGEQQDLDKNQQEQDQQQAMQPQQAEMTDEQREQMQRMQNLLNRVPDDPAFLLKRKMMLESRQRQRERSPRQSQRNW